MLHSPALLLVFGLSLVRGPQDADEPSVVGPMVGHVEAESAIVWVYLGPEESGVLRWWREGDSAASEQQLVADPQRHHSAVAELDDLEPGTRYRYQLSCRGQSRPSWSGSFVTAPEAGTPGRFRMAFASCMNIGDANHSSWFLMLAQRPAFHLLLGDTVYSDTTDPVVQWEHHLRYRRVPEFAAVLRQVPTYAMWDDHDYGPNNSDGTASGKERSLEAFRGLFANPGAGTASTPGAFYSFRWGDVEFFVLDGRYHRTPNDAPDDDQKRMLGDAQFEWLLSGLKASTATFRVLASGSTLQVSSSDGWRRFTFSRDRLYSSLGEHDIGGVLYLSGDLHVSRLDVHPTTDSVGYALPEITSSGITRGKQRGFATLDFDTTLEDPEVRVRILHGDGAVHLDRRFLRSELAGR